MAEHPSTRGKHCTEGKEPSAEREEQRGRDQEELPAVWKNNYLIA